MDNQKLGTFVSSLREKRGMTQKSLAEKLNVTDKTVSKWEKGDKPTSKALTTDIPDAVRYQYRQQIEKRNTLIGVISVIAVIMTVFLIDNMGWLGFLMIPVPIVLLGIGIILIAFCIHSHKLHLSSSTALIWGIAALLCSVIIFLLPLLLFLVGVLTGDI